MRKLTDKIQILGRMLREPATSGECRLQRLRTSRRRRPQRASQRPHLPTAVQGGGIDLTRLAEELGRPRAAMRQEPAGPPEQDEAVGAVAAAEKAARQGDQEQEP